MNYILLAIGAIAIYFFVLRKEPEIKKTLKQKQKDAEDELLLTEGPDVNEQAAIIASVLKKAGRPGNLRSQPSCVPRFNTQSHKDGRAPWIPSEGESCNKPGNTVGFVLQAVHGPVLFAWTGDPTVFNFNRVIDEDSNVAYFVTTPGIGLRAAFNFRRGKWLGPSDYKPKRREVWPSNLDPNSKYPDSIRGQIGSPGHNDYVAERADFLKLKVWPG